MKVVPVDQAMEQVFWNHVNQDPLNYYFAIFDMRFRRDQTQIYLAVDDEKVRGLALVYADHIVQFRGDRQAVQLLLNNINVKKVELLAPIDCEDLVAKRYKPGNTDRMMLMSMGKGEENLQIRHSLVRLGVKDAESVAEIMREADPQWWGEVTAERQSEPLQNAFWLGIKRDNRLVSIGSTRIVDFASNIGVIATEEDYRNMGFATSVVSGLVREIFKTSPIAVIHVLADNPPAIHVYSKVGFKPYKTYFSMRGSLRT